MSYCPRRQLEFQWGGAFLGRATSKAAGWLLGASVTVHLGTATGWQSHEPDHEYRPRKTAPWHQCDHSWLFGVVGVGDVNTVDQVAWGPKVWVLVLALPRSCLAFGVALSPHPPSLPSLQPLSLPTLCLSHTNTSPNEIT